MKHFLTIIGLALLLISCQREPMEVITPQTPVINPPQVPITGGLIGTVYSEDQNAVADAIVTLPGHQTTTDANGKFSFENINLYSDGSYLTIDKPGMHLASRKFYAIEGETNVVQLEMQYKEIDTELNSNEDDILGSEYMVFNVPATHYLDQSNESYDGQVNVDIIEMPLGENENSFKIPGDLTGVDSNFDVKAISNFGIFKLHFTSQSGERLQFPADYTASFTFKNPEVELSQIPNDLILWYFDEVNGTWIEKGQAIYSSDSFSGEIDQLGYWMLGIAYDYADIKGSIMASNVAFPNTRMDVQNFDLAYLSSINTTMSGMYSTRVPQSVDLDLAIFHDCNVGRQIENLGVLDANQDFDAIEIEGVMDNIEILGKITDCNGTNNSMPYLKVNFGDDQFMYRSDEFGNFNFSFSNCTEDEVSIVAIDDKTSSVSESLLLPVNNSIDLGEIETCEQVVAGYDITYENMDWSDNLESSMIHEWTVSRVEALENKKIFSAKMIDQETGELYLNAAFVFVEGEATAEYALNFKAQGGFAIFGECNFEETNHGSFTSYRFIGTDAEIEGSIDDTIFPNGINEVNFDLVYYD